MSAKVWALGDAVVDLLPDGHGRLLQCPGGAPANVAVGVARLGGASGFIGRVGHDPFGAFMTQTLKEENVDTGAMHQDRAHRTSTVVVALDDRGERSFTFMVRPSADLFLNADDLPPFGAGEWLHVCSIALCAQPSRDTEAMARIKRAGGFVSFDPNIREDLWPDTAQLRECIERALALADVVKLSLEELAFIAGADDEESALALARRHAIPLLLITRGAEGVDALLKQGVHPHCRSDAVHHGIAQCQVGARSAQGAVAQQENGYEPYKLFFHIQPSGGHSPLALLYRACASFAIWKFLAKVQAL